jgi:hypothetical protein
MITADIDTTHRRYHGAPVVELVLAVADWWRRRQAMAPAGRVQVGRWPRSAVAAASVAALMLLTGKAVAQDTVRVRGTIEEVADGVYMVRARDDRRLKLRLTPNASIAASIRSSLADIRPGLYIGVAAVPGADGSLRALEAHIFDETMRGTAEGHRAWDLLPASTMTNAAVQEIVSAVDGHTVTLRYKGGQQRITIPPTTTIVTYVPGSVSELKPGAVLFVPTAASQPDGTLIAQRVMVGRDIAPPQ